MFTSSSNSGEFYKQKHTFKFSEKVFYSNNMVFIWFTVLLLVFLIYKSTRKPKNFPPGPPRLPVVGSLPYMGVESKPSEPKSLLTGIRKGTNIFRYMSRHIIS